jgi:RNA polymerase sigma-70 factor (ECF subfamily)
MDANEYLQENSRPRADYALKKNLRDLAVFENVYEEYAPRLLKHAFFRTGNEEEAKDVVAQVFFRTWRYLINPKNEIRDIKAFLYRLTNNLIIDYYRQRSKTQFVSFEVVQESIKIEETVYPFGAVEAQIDLDRIWEEIQDLRDDYKALIVWRHIDELTINEISKLIGKSKGATAVMIFRAKQALKAELKRKNENKKDN